MKKREVPKELVKKTINTLNELESAVLNIKTGVTAGDIVDPTFPGPTTEYGCSPPECNIDR